MSYGRVPDLGRLQVFDLLEEEIEEGCSELEHLDPVLERRPKRATEIFTGPAIEGKQENDRRYVLDSDRGASVFDITVEDYAAPLIIDHGDLTEVDTEESRQLRNIKFELLDGDETVFNIVMDNLYEEFSDHSDRYSREDGKRTYVFPRNGIEL